MNPIMEVPLFALRNLKQQSLRSALTFSGVIIGVAAIITLFTLSAGLNEVVEQQFEQLGSNTLYVFPSALFSGSGVSSINLKTLSESTQDKIRFVPEVQSVLPQVYAQGTMQQGKEKSLVYIVGSSPSDVQDYMDAGFLVVTEGRIFKSNETFSVLVGEDLVEDAFTNPIRLGGSLIIEGKSFKVIGFMSQPSKVAGDPSSPSNSLMISDKGFAQLFSQVDPLFLLVKVNTALDVTPAKEKIERVLEKVYGKDQPYFLVYTSEQLLDQFNQLFGIVQLVLIGIASISLLVGGIGIMNTMIMSVLERTSEIGLMKAVGATDTLVLSVFLAEAGIIGLVGGIFGLIIGYALAFVVKIVADASGFGLVIELDPFLIVGGLLFSILIGMLSGYIPSRNAAKMDPVVAMRGTI
ncbi:MAG: ABC transporter permease [Candidatus Diapherotrites archaeon]